MVRIDRPVADMRRHQARQRAVGDERREIVVVVTRQPGVMAGCNEYDYSTDPYAVRVRITQPRNTFLARLAGPDAFTIGACAVASLSADNDASFVVLKDMTVSGGSVVTVAGSTAVNAKMTVSGGGSYTSAGGVHPTTRIILWPKPSSTQPRSRPSTARARPG